MLKLMEVNMLVDSILEELKERRFKKLQMPSFYRNLEIFMKYVVASPKFILTEPMVYAIESITRSKPSFFISGLDLCKLPYDKMWVEFPFISRLNFLKNEGIEDQLITAINKEVAPAPKLLGYFLEQITNQHIGVTLAWEHYDKVISLGFKSMIIYIGNMDIENRQIDPKSLRKDSKWTQSFSNNLDELKKLSELSDRIQDIWSPYSKSQVKEFVQLYQGSKEEAVRIIEEHADYDIIGEWRYVLGLLMMLNTKNSIEFEEIDRSKLNRARVKSGKPATFNYSKIKLKMSKVVFNRIKSLHGSKSRAEAIPHWVRGHFKIRKNNRTGESKLFWWSSHLRNAASENKEKHIMPPTYILD